MVLCVFQVLASLSLLKADYCYRLALFDWPPVPQKTKQENSLEKIQSFLCRNYEELIAISFQ